jgi:hypothetical protein
MQGMLKKQELGKASFEYKKDVSHFPQIRIFVFYAQQRAVNANVGFRSCYTCMFERVGRFLLYPKF